MGSASKTKNAGSRLYRSGWKKEELTNMQEKTRTLLPSWLVPRKTLLHVPPHNVESLYLRCFAQVVGIAEGLAYLHEKDVIHGDMKAVSTH